MSRSRLLRWVVAVPLILLAAPRPASASKVGWMDDVVRRVLKSSDPDLARAGRSSGRLFGSSGDESLAALARQSDEIAQAGRPIDEATEAALEGRFAKLMDADPEMTAAFRALEPTEKRLVLRMGEAAERLARRYPNNADEMVRSLGVEGMTAVRVYGDDVAGVIAREGPESINVLRKAGRPGWKFYVGPVLRHKKKLAAAGVLGLFLANPERFIDSAGRITEFAVEKFAEAGIQLAGAIGSGAARGLENSFAERLGLGGSAARIAAIVAAGTAAVLAVAVLIGLPIRWLTMPFRLVGRGLRATVRSS